MAWRDQALMAEIRDEIPDARAAAADLLAEKEKSVALQVDHADVKARAPARHGQNREPARSSNSSPAILFPPNSLLFSLLSFSAAWLSVAWCSRSWGWRSRSWRRLTRRQASSRRCAPSPTRSASVDCVLTHPSPLERCACQC
eukprot:490097-Rhodomonas_salina.2